MAEIIYGTSGKDSLYDYGDNYYNIDDYSTINAGEGNDDIYIGYHTNVSIYGGAGADTINHWRYAVNSTLNGGNGNDSIYSRQSNSMSIIGESGHDTIYNESWGSTINGGKGNDLISLQSASNLIKYKLSEGNDTIWGFNSTDSIKITGSTYSTTKSGSDVIIKVGTGSILLKDIEGNAIQINGKNVADNSTNPKRIILSDGDDYFRGNLDNITISGGNGNDTIINGDGPDKHSYSMNVSISGGAGDDYIVTHCEEEYMPEYKLIRSPDNSTINGGKGNDTIGNDNGKNVLFQYSLGDGNDIIYGFEADSTLSISGGEYSTTTSGNDVIVTVGDGKISLIGAANLDAINIASEKAATLLTVNNSTPSPLTVGSSVKIIDASTRTKKVKITGNALANTIKGGSNKDSLYGGDGNDKLYGNAGNDYLSGSDGHDTLSGYTGDDKLLGGAGNDSLSGGAGKDTLSGGSGKDILLGDKGHDSLNGGSNNDKLYGGSGNDTLIGGKGNDSLWGDSGADTFLYNSGDGNDIIYGFDSKDTLTLDIDDFKASYSKTSGIITLTFDDGSIKLKDYTATTFHINNDTYKISGSKFVKK